MLYRRLPPGGPAGGGDPKDAGQTVYSPLVSCPRDSWQPHIVVVNQGTNEPGIPGKKYTEHYVHYLEIICSAFRKALIFGVCPFNGTHRDAIRTAVDERDKRGDKRVRFVDTNGWYDGPLHPSVEGSALHGEKMAAAIKRFI